MLDHRGPRSSGGAGAVSEADLRLLLDVVGEINAIDDLAQFRASVCDLLGRLVPFDIAGYNEIGPGETLAMNTRPIPAELMAQFTAHAYQNPLISRYAKTRDGRPYRISDVVDRESFRRLEIYKRFYREVGIEFQVAFTLPSAPPLIIGLVLCRGSADFSDREVQLLALVRPHLIQAYRSAEATSASRALVAALEAGLTLAGRDLVVLDGRGRVEFASRGARGLLGDGGLRRLPAAVASSPPGRRGGATTAKPLAFAADGRRVLIHALQTGQGGQPTVLLVRPEEPGPTPTALSGFGLTRREAEVLSRITRGGSPAQASSDLGIARRTVDKHLQNVYAKLGVADRRQAVATARAAVGFDWPPAPGQD
jgi:DNA-binding CsgD family transcriptional regulator